MLERSHRVRLTFDEGVATLRVRRTVFNGGDHPDVAELWIEVPDGAVATGLRLKGRLNGKPRWFEGELKDADLARAHFKLLTGIGGYSHNPPPAKDPALLSWSSESNLVLQVFPLAPRTPKTVEYTLVMPTDYVAGRDRLELEALGTDEHPAEVVVRSSDRSDQLFVDDRPVPRDFRLTLDEPHTVSVARHHRPQIEAHLASVALGHDMALLHAEVALAPELSRIPRGARIVVLIDGSRSMSDDEREAELRAARAYLGHFADARLDARAEVLVFDRTVKGRNGGLVSVRKAIEDLEDLELKGGNGSQVEDALAQASELLVRSRGPRRIVVFTDTRTRASLRPEALRTPAVRSGAVVHFARFASVSDDLIRNDVHRWADVARTTGGLVWDTHASVEAEDASLVYEELARPMRLDHLAVFMPSAYDGDVGPGGALAEGEGVDKLDFSIDPVERMRVVGELWSSPVSQTVFPQEEHSRRWAALVFGQSMSSALDEEQMTTLALLGGAVSPVTSYLALEPGARPAAGRVVQDEPTGFILRGGMGGGGWPPRDDHRRVVAFGTRDSGRQQFLNAAVREALDACGGDGEAATVELESTLTEIVHVRAVEILGNGDPALRDCLAEGVWAISLRYDFDDELRNWAIDLPV